jgi:hypothetical protein
VSIGQPTEGTYIVGVKFQRAVEDVDGARVPFLGLLVVLVSPVGCQPIGFGAVDAQV